MHDLLHELSHEVQSTWFWSLVGLFALAVKQHIMLTVSYLYI